MNKNPAEIGERIKAARKAAGLSQTELANRLSKTLRTVQKYESGEIEPSIAIINAMAKELKVSPADLIGYQRPSIELNTISDVLTVLYQLNKKAGLRFEIDKHRIGIRLTAPYSPERRAASSQRGKENELLHNPRYIKP